MAHTHLGCRRRLHLYESRHLGRSAARGSRPATCQSRSLGETAQTSRGDRVGRAVCPPKLLRRGSGTAAAQKSSFASADQNYGVGVLRSLARTHVRCIWRWKRHGADSWTRRVVIMRVSGTAVASTREVGRGREEKKVELLSEAPIAQQSFVM